MLQDLGSGDAAVFGDVTDEKHRHLVRLGKLVHLGSGLTDLRDASRRGVDVWRTQGLYGVDNNDIGLHVLEMLHNLLGVGLGQNQAVLVADADTIGTHLDLGLTLLTGDIQHLLTVYL